MTSFLNNYKYKPCVLDAQDSLEAQAFLAALFLRPPLCHLEYPAC